MAGTVGGAGSATRPYRPFVVQPELPDSRSGARQPPYPMLPRIPCKPVTPRASAIAGRRGQRRRDRAGCPPARRLASRIRDLSATVVGERSHTAARTECPAQSAPPSATWGANQERTRPPTKCRSSRTGHRSADRRSSGDRGSTDQSHPGTRGTRRYRIFARDYRRRVAPAPLPFAALAACRMWTARNSPSGSTSPSACARSSA